MVTAPGSSTPVPVPFAGLGIMTIDYQGRETDHATAAAGGQIQEVDSSGTIQVNPDCTATETWTFGGEQFTGRYVILDNGNEMRYLPTKFPGGPTVGIAYLRRLSWGEPQCTSDMVRGVYAGSYEGTVMMLVPGQSQPVPTPAAAILAITFQHGGTGTATATASLGGTILDVDFSKLSIDVNPDCTATLNYTAVSRQLPGQTFTGSAKYIVLNQGNELWALATKDSGGLPVMVESYKRISMMPLASDR